MESFYNFIFTLAVISGLFPVKRRHSSWDFDSKEINVCLLFRHNDLGPLPVSTYLLMTVRMYKV